MSLLAILFSLLSGFFFIIGFTIVQFTKNRKSLSIFSISMAFVVMIGLIFLDLMPEVFEVMDSLSSNSFNKVFYAVLFITIGFLTLKLMDKFVPSHHHDHREHELNKKEHQSHLFHIGFVLSLSLILHNLIEGMSIYLLTVENMGLGFLFSLGVGLHNLPLGIEIASGLESQKKKQKTENILFTFLILSSFLGAILLAILKIQFTGMTLLFLLCLSLGMILYIALFELLKEIFQYKKHKEVFYGMIVGIVLLIIINLIA